MFRRRILCVQILDQQYYISDCFSEFIQAVFSRIEQVYNDRKLFLNIGILELGDNTKSKDEVMLKCIELMHLLLKKNLMLKNEEITFFGSLVTYMYEVKEIAPITIFLMERKLSQIIEESSCTAISNTAWEKAKSDLNTLRNAAYFLLEGKSALAVHHEMILKCANSTHLALLIQLCVRKSFPIRWYDLYLIAYV